MQGPWTGTPHSSDDGALRNQLVSGGSSMAVILVAKHLAQFRHDEGLRQLDVARHVGVSKSMVGYWENGMAVCRVAHLQRLADLFGVTPERILGRRSR